VNGPPLTARAVAELLGVSPETVLRGTRRGELPAIRLPGGAIRYGPDALEAWLAERAAAPRRGVSPTPQDAADWQRTATGGTLAAVTHPEGEED
jgi:excisionase family DNA binding protein